MVLYQVCTECVHLQVVHTQPLAMDIMILEGAVAPGLDLSVSQLKLLPRYF